jgi:hypothetical protein
MKKVLPDPVILLPQSKIWLASGRYINLDPLDVSQVAIEDAAYGLSNMPRYGGQIARKFRSYNVAQHSIYVSYYSGPRKRAGLGHDKTEGLGLMDLPRPIKYLPGFEPYREFEYSVDHELNIAWNLEENCSSVKRADDQVLVAFGHPDYKAAAAMLKSKGYMEIVLDIEIWSAEKSEQMFLERWYNLLDEEKNRGLELSHNDYPGID